jgi:hypothetical protein
VTPSKSGGARLTEPPRDPEPAKAHGRRNDTNPYRQRNDGGWCECAECGRLFGGLRGFDLHHINMAGQPGHENEYDTRCATGAELEARGMRLSRIGWWIRTDGYSGVRGSTSRHAASQPGPQGLPEPNPPSAFSGGGQNEAEAV